MSAPPTRIINIDNFIFPQPCHNTIINITQCNTRYNIKNANKSTKSYVLQTNLIYKTLSSNLKKISFTTYQKSIGKPSGLPHCVDKTIMVLSTLFLDA